MSVFRRPNGKWVAQIHDRQTGRMRQVGTYATKRDAQRAEQQEIDRRTASGRETVRSFATRWTSDYPRPRASTDVHNAERVKAFAVEHGRRRMDSITLDEAREWALKHRAQLPALRAMFNDARRSGIVMHNPFAALGIERSRGRRDLPSDWLTEPDIVKLEEAALAAHGDYGPTMAAMVRFAAETGVRPGEMFALQLADLHGDTITVRRSANSRTRTIEAPKNGRERTIVYPRAAQEAVKQASRLVDQTLVFAGPRGGQIWASAFSWLWKPVRVAAGRPNMAFYELRHYCATRLLEKGLTPADVAVQLGHTDGGALVMAVYGHPSERAARARILAVLDGYDTGDVAELRRKGA